MAEVYGGSRVSASFLGYTLTGPRRLHPKRIAKATARVESAAAWLREYDRLLTARDRAKGDPRSLNLKLDEHYRSVEGTELEWILRADELTNSPEMMLAGRCAAGPDVATEYSLIARFLDLWKNGSYDSITASLDHLREGWQVLTVGAVTYGDTPDTEAYKTVELAFAMCIIPILGIE